MTEIETGEQRAWQVLSEQDPADVCARTGCSYNKELKVYTIQSLGYVFTFNTEKQEILPGEPGGELLIRKLSYFFRLSALWYLARAKDANPSGKLIKPSNLKGGDLFFRGSHVLPLEAVSGKYAHDREGFLSRGLALGGKPTCYGDASVELRPFPGVPVTVILWTEDDEFPARADLLFDATAEVQLPLDILWSIAMMSLLVFLQH